MWKRLDQKGRGNFRLGKMNEENVDKNSQKLFGDELQQELEKLSWEFLLKEKEEKEKMILEQTVKVQEKKEEDVSDYYSGYKPREMSQNFDFWHRDDEANINSYQRDSGIIFNEEKLQAQKIIEWTKAPKLRETKWNLFWLAMGKIFLWPFRAVLAIAVGTTTVVGKSVIGIADLVYQFIKGVIILFQAIGKAFYAIFVYLFGDLSWLLTKEKELEPVAVVNEEIEMVSRGSIGYRRFRPVLAFASVALLLILPLQGYLFYQKAEQVKGEVLGASESGIGHLASIGTVAKDFNLDEVDKEFILAGQEFASAQARFKELGLAANGASVLVPDVKAGKQLLEVAIRSAEIGRLLVETGKALGNMAGQVDYQQVKTAMEGDTLKVENKTEASIDWQQLNKNLDEALIKAREVGVILQEVDLENTKLVDYKGQIEEARNQMPIIVSWLESYQDLTKLATEVLGVDEPRRWLFVFQNNTEIRPTGGFMGSYAVVDIDQGKIKKIEVPGGGFYDLKGSLAAMVDAPYPFHVFSPIWQPWNANWFPDWPASAEKIMWFYNKSGGPSVDGVISFTPDVLTDLLKLTGAITMPEYGVTVDSDNFTRTAQIEVEFNYNKEENKPKKFIGDLLPKVMEKTMSLTGESKMRAWEQIFTSLEQKAILIYLKKANNQEAVDRLGWSGKVKQYDKDYLSVIHTNIAGGKTDMVVSNKIEHQVEILSDGQIVDTVILTKEHKGLAGDVFEGQINIDYVRFYVPQGSKLLSAVGFDSLPAGRQFLTATSGVEADPDLTRWEKNTLIDQETGVRITEEFGKTSFGSWFIVEPGQTKRVTLKYLLPWRLGEGNSGEPEGKDNIWELLKKYFGKQEANNVKNKESFIYGLLVQKQAGSASDQYSGALKLEGRWLIEEYLPAEGIVSENNGSLGIKWNLETDKYYGLMIKEK